MALALVTEKLILDALRSGNREIQISDSTKITPLAKDRAKEVGIIFVKESSSALSMALPEFTTIAIGSDHSGFEVKAELKKLLVEKNYRLIDFGTDSETTCDYPDFAFAVGEAVRNGRATFGIMIDGVGTASAIVLNKIPTIRATGCYNEFSAKIARGHGNANVLTLGARSLGIEVIKSIVLTFLTTPFEGERHEKRLQKIRDIEQKFLK